MENVMEAKYLVAVRGGDIWKFPSKRSARGFMSDIVKAGYECAIAKAPKRKSGAK